MKELIATSEVATSEDKVSTGHKRWRMSLTASKHKKRKQMVAFHSEGVVKKFSNSVSLIFTRELRHDFENSPK